MSRRLFALALVALVPAATACGPGAGSTAPADPPAAVVVATAPPATPTTVTPGASSAAPAATVVASSAATLQQRVEAELAATDRALADADDAIATPAG